MKKLRSRRQPALAALLVGVASVAACTKDEQADPSPPSSPPTTSTSPVVFDLNEVPYDSLSTYHFYEGTLAELQPAIGLLPFAPITPLFSDYAHKSRYIWMPDGVSATYDTDSTVLDLPNGSVLIKNFYYDHVQPSDERRILETRLMFRRNGVWEFADYVWNEEQTEAVLDLDGSFVPITWLGDDNVTHDVTYRIPALAECQTCHKLGNASSPIGPKPQNINSAYAYSSGSMNQLAKWEEVGYLSGGFPATINTLVRWDDPTQSLSDRVRAYVDMNCSHCHGHERYCAYRPMRFAWHDTMDPAKLGVCVEPHDPLLPIHTHIVKPGNPDKSLLYYRINSAEIDVRMPLMGRTMIHEESRVLIEAWINSLTGPCN